MGSMYFCFVNYVTFMSRIRRGENETTILVLVPPTRSTTGSTRYQVLILLVQVALFGLRERKKDSKSTQPTASSVMNKNLKKIHSPHRILNLPDFLLVIY